MNERARINLSLGSILLLGLILRLVGVNFGLPHLYHADEPVIVNHALAYGLGDLNPHFFRVPPLVSYFLFFLCGCLFVIGKVFGIFPDIQSFENLYYSDPTIFYLIGRGIFGILIGTLSVLAVYRLALRFCDQKRALLAAFLLGVCFLHVRESHYLYVDIPLVWVMLLSFCVFWRLEKSGDNLRSHLLCGAMVGLATAVKYNGVMLAFPYLFLSWHLSPRKDLLKNWLVSGISAVLIYTILNPFSFLKYNFGF